MGYAAAAVQGLEACPFCKELFPHGERGECPLCGVPLIAASKVSASVDASDDEDDGDQEERLSWMHWGHGRGPVVVASLLGLALFALPWVSQFTPDRAVYSGIELAQRTRMGWAAGVAWFTLLPVVLSRLTVSRLRGARLAAALLALIPGIVAGILFANPPGAIRVYNIVVTVRFEWSPAIYATLALSLATALMSFFWLGKGPTPGRSA